MTAWDLSGAGGWFVASHVCRHGQSAITFVQCCRVTWTWDVLIDSSGQHICNQRHCQSTGKWSTCFLGSRLSTSSPVARIELMVKIFHWTAHCGARWHMERPSHSIAAMRRETVTVKGNCGPHMANRSCAHDLFGPEISCHGPSGHYLRKITN